MTQLENSSLEKFGVVCLVQGCRGCVLKLCDSFQQLCWLHMCGITNLVLSDHAANIHLLRCRVWALWRVFGWRRFTWSTFCFAAEWDHKSWTDCFAFLWPRTLCSCEPKLGHVVACRNLITLRLLEGKKVSEEMPGFGEVSSCVPSNEMVWMVVTTFGLN